MRPADQNFKEKCRIWSRTSEPVLDAAVKGSVRPLQDRGRAEDEERATPGPKKARQQCIEVDKEPFKDEDAGSVDTVVDADGIEGSF